MVNGMEYCPDCGSQVLHIEGCNLCSFCGWSACGCGIYCEKRKAEENGNYNYIEKGELSHARTT